MPFRPTQLAPLQSGRSPNASCLALFGLGEACGACGEQQREAGLRFSQPAVQSDSLSLNGCCEIGSRSTARTSAGAAAKRTSEMCRGYIYIYPYIYTNGFPPLQSASTVNQNNGKPLAGQQPCLSALSTKTTALQQLLEELLRRRVWCAPSNSVNSSAASFSSLPLLIKSVYLVCFSSAGFSSVADSVNRAKTTRHERFAGSLKSAPPPPLEALLVGRKSEPNASQMRAKPPKPATCLAGPASPNSPN